MSAAAIGETIITTGRDQRRRVSLLGMVMANIILDRRGEIGDDVFVGQSVSKGRNPEADLGGIGRTLKELLVVALDAIGLAFGA